LARRQGPLFFILLPGIWTSSLLIKAKTWKEAGGFPFRWKLRIKGSFLSEARKGKGSLKGGGLP